MNNQPAAVEVTDIDFNGDGWHIKVGQFYSSPYSESHIKIVRIELAEDKDPNNAKIFFQCVNPRNYEELVTEYVGFHRAWHINDGTWDLERDVELPQKELGLIVKYDVRKVDTGELVNNCFVLRPDKDPNAVIALRTYAEVTGNATLREDIHNWLDSLRE